MDTAVLMEIENLRRASLSGKFRSRHREHLFRKIAWRLQALAEGDLSERAMARAQEITRDAGLRLVAPRDFFLVGGEPVQTTRRDRNRRDDKCLPIPEYFAEPEVNTLLTRPLLDQCAIGTVIIATQSVGE